MRIKAKPAEHTTASGIDREYVAVIRCLIGDQHLTLYAGLLERAVQAKCGNARTMTEVGY